MIWAKIEKNGKGLAIQIPEDLAQECGLEAGSEVRLVKFLGGFRVIPKDEEYYTLEELLVDMPDNYETEEWDTGPAVGKEIWW